MWPQCLKSSGVWVGERGWDGSTLFAQFEMKQQSSCFNISRRDSLRLSYWTNASVSSRSLAASALAVTGNFSQIYLTPQGKTLGCQLEPIRERAWRHADKRRGYLLYLPLLSAPPRSFICHWGLHQTKTNEANHRKVKWSWGYCGLMGKHCVCLSSNWCYFRSLFLDFSVDGFLNRIFVYLQ